MDLRALDLIAVFVQVVDSRSFRAAAKALGMSKSTVSLKVAQLEDTLGARLLERTTRTLKLTEVGTAFYAQSQPALSQLHEAGQHVLDTRARPSGRLRIAMLFEPGQLLLSGILSEYLARYPEVHVDVELTDRYVDLVNEGFDVALRPGPLPDSSLKSLRFTMSGGLKLYASPTYLRGRSRLRRPEDLASHDCLVMSTKHHPTQWDFVQGRRKVALRVKERMRVNSFVLLRDLAVAGHGITRLPETFARPAVRAGKLRAVLEDFAPPPVEWHALYPSARNLSPKVRAFLEVLEQRFLQAFDGLASTA
ncbi:LysR family transcriptional regulator [Myxococcus stipitatus DSM 14675]|uniref:LysR family transcriptional regulator n=1 Tax=Myxococcus stipitatus (strain DSM 14675 / JCM 12634 / Mx s8) TaxID=1278073 RepID=L7UL98_MYXSD|nr:LysR family transcriptional regulator [Myxococcus stipitatus]AGC48685.1 LysR family transcriptional regulator [Myxococcus stipitatus DSM 14675]